ncbi:unnamed protein product [Linum tenue]|uniref:non-specific serine/threonine protein kinase n=1 Tax=Linum tenue TaxID=586396 RepID=A0AAV0GUU5_9ROSI|nr:unnamed protein product [Linum tenue]
MEFFKIPPLFLLLLSSIVSLAGGQSSSGNQITKDEHQALLDFKSKITSDPFGFLNSWTSNYTNSSSSSIHYCKWAGVTCDGGNQRVTELDLSSQLLRGSISPSIANLSSLRELWLYNNSFSGEIPPGIGSLTSLQILALQSNLLTGEIPANISGCSDLAGLVLGDNRLVGKIPDSFGGFKKLWILNLEFNNLTGGIPPSLGNVSTLEQIATTSNSIGGTIPESFGRLKKLNYLSMGGNFLTGTIPASIYNITSMGVLCFPVNQLQGTIPPDIGNLLPNLTELNVGDNQFTGTIPASLSNASNLERFTIAVNRISGTMPSMAKMHKLWWLSISTNLLGTGEAGDLDFLSTISNRSSLQLVSLSANNFGGSLPKTVVNFTELSILTMDVNKISGSIPEGMANLKKLELLDMGNNQFTGSVPEELGKLGNLKKLHLQRNEFSDGRIPSSFGNLSQLTHLHMQYSSIQGTIPPSLGNCRNLLSLNLDGNNLAGEIPGDLLSISSLTIYLGLAENRLTGSFPRQVGTLKNLGILNVSHNLLSGEIPASLGSCVRLETLLLQNNSFQGSIPSSLSSLKGIQVLNFANNNLTGEIPEFIGSFQSLTSLNLSFNGFHGRVPNEGVFRNSTAASISGNGELCGGISEFRLPVCSKLKEKSKAKRFSTAEKAMIIGASSLALLALFLSPLFLLCIKRKKRVEPDEEASPNRLPQMSYHSLRKATEDFSPQNLIGTGSFGCVYKGIDPNDGDKIIAVKVLNLLHPAAAKSFRAECEVLREVRHRNLVKLLTSCSSVDGKGNEFMALVYEFMANGSLDEWLHQDPEIETDPDLEFPPRRKQLNLLQRLNIATDVASALEYLHHGLKTPIAHCDLKPSNVLVNHEMTGLVGDFGLARLFPEAIAANLSSSLSSSFGVRGTIGYTAPEYGMGNEVSTSGDVYSYGMLLLEMFTGKRPTDEMFKDGLNLHRHAEVGSWTEAREILDVVLVDEIEGASISFATTTMVQECVVSILGIGIAASVESPGERMRISDIAVELDGIRDKLAEDW